MRIGVFDSGIGGLTVLKSLIERHPNHEYFYFGDTKNLPYGEKTKEQLLLLTKNNINFLLTKHVDMIIIACGTISSTVYKDVKDIYNVPIIDVINPTIKYIKDCNHKKMGIIATYRTINSKIFENRLDVPVISQACPIFVPLIESKNIDSEEFNKYLHEYLNPFKNQDIDALVLGCTHYPLISEQIKDYLKEDVELINLGDIIAKSINLPHEHRQNIELYFSSIDDTLISNVNNIMGDYKINKKEL